MKIKKNQRKFKVGKKQSISLCHVATVTLKKNELVTFKNDKREYDLVKKGWGFYGTPSLNKRLNLYGYSAALVINNFNDTYFVMIVDIKKKKYFLKYLKSENMKVICWLDIKNLSKIRNFFN